MEKTPTPTFLVIDGYINKVLHRNWYISDTAKKTAGCAET